MKRMLFEAFVKGMGVRGGVPWGKGECEEEGGG
jgi:hypothetical protein